MTDNEILKALECCIKHECADCPAKAMFCNASVPMAFALNLITRQRAEIEEFEKFEGKLKAEKAYVMYFKQQIKSEAIKEFAERLKESRKQYKGTLAGWTFTMAELDNLVQEMAGEENGTL